MTTNNVIPFPTRRIGPVGPQRGGSGSAVPVREPAWRLEVWPADDGLPERLWVCIDDELDGDQVRDLARLLERARQLT